MTSASTQTRSVRCRRLVLRDALQATVGLILAAMVIDTWLLGGLVVPAVVSGGSMAPTLLGEHLSWSCAQCGDSFACNAESLPANGLDVACPACGHANALASGIVSPGQRVLINRSAFSWRKPRRWEAVVLRSPEQLEMLCVKRVVGLPGEVVAIRDGEVMINGVVARKSGGAQTEMAVAVASPRVAQERWRPEPAGTWEWHDDKCVHPASKTEAIDWLVYHHAEPLVDSDGRQPPILDGSNSDQNESRQLNAVADVLLRCEVTGPADGTCYFRARSRGDDFRVTLPLGKGIAKLSHNGSRVKAARVDGGGPASRKVELVVSDQRVRLSLAGNTVLEYEYEPTAGKHPETGLGIGAADSTVTVSQIEVLRDVYYTTAPRAPSQYRLGPDEYFVLGDNSPHSVDSRRWAPQGGVSAGLLLGPAVAW